MLLFVDESGKNDTQTPYEVLAGISIAEKDLWNLIKAIRATEKDCFGDYLRNLRPTEVKASKLLKRKSFKFANKRMEIPQNELPQLAHTFLKKGLAAYKAKERKSNFTLKEIIGYNRSVLNFVNKVIDISAGYGVKVFASVSDNAGVASQPDFLKRDFIFLFERYFYFLSTLPENARGLVVFDELEKSMAQRLIQQMAGYFLGTKTGQFRSSKIIPEPFFVHSELTTGVFLADLTAYIINWGWRLKCMTRQYRPELKPFADKLHDMQFVGTEPARDSDNTWPLYGIKYIAEREKSVRIEDVI
jgi:hypothetical protein